MLQGGTSFPTWMVHCSVCNAIVEPTVIIEDDHSATIIWGCCDMMATTNTDPIDIAGALNGQEEVITV